MPLLGPTVLAQAAPAMAENLPPQVREWIDQAKALEDKGSYQEALLLQEKVLQWARANLGGVTLSSRPASIAWGF
ncbi:hypothetical protein [Cyanobium sp. ATX-6F1]|uniref:hypothetical protein n=1 Tax=Cyanobium sp. ATX-6F1 TaxID=3137388 RepID=UPI0039BE0CD0